VNFVAQKRKKQGAISSQLTRILFILLRLWWFKIHWMDKEAYINMILEKTNSRITQNWKDFPMKDFLAIFNNKTLHQIFETSQDIIDESMMLDYFNDPASTIYIIESMAFSSLFPILITVELCRTETENQNVLEGFVVVGKFDPSPGDLTWPKWRDKKMPPNNNVC
jgi:hypothetical protein